MNHDDDTHTTNRYKEENDNQQFVKSMHTRLPAWDKNHQK